MVSGMCLIDRSTALHTILQMLGRGVNKGHRRLILENTVRGRQLLLLSRGDMIVRLVCPPPRQMDQRESLLTFGSALRKGIDDGERARVLIAEGLAHSLQRLAQQQLSGGEVALVLQ